MADVETAAEKMRELLREYYCNILAAAQGCGAEIVCDDLPTLPLECNFSNFVDLFKMLYDQLLELRLLENERFETELTELKAQNNAKLQELVDQIYSLGGIPGELGAPTLGTVAFETTANPALAPYIDLAIEQGVPLLDVIPPGFFLNLGKDSSEEGTGSSGPCESVNVMSSNESSDNPSSNGPMSSESSVCS